MGSVLDQRKYYFVHHESRHIPLMTAISYCIFWYINQPFGSYESLQKIDVVLYTD